MYKECDVGKRECDGQRHDDVVPMEADRVKGSDKGKSKGKDGKGKDKGAAARAVGQRSTATRRAKSDTQVTTGTVRRVVQGSRVCRNVGADCLSAAFRQVKQHCRFDSGHHFWL